MPKAIKSFNGIEQTRTFSDEVWRTGVPSKNGWRQIDYNTEVIARKLPEQAEIASKKAEVIVVDIPEPEMPEVIADEVVAEPVVAEPVVAEPVVAEPVVATKPEKPAKKVK